MDTSQITAMFIYFLKSSNPKRNHPENNNTLTREQLLTENAVRSKKRAIEI